MSRTILARGLNPVCDDELVALACPEPLSMIRWPYQIAINLAVNQSGVPTMMPKQREIEIPLLKCLDEMGGKAKPSDVYPRLSKVFPDLTESDLAEPLNTGGNKWKNRIQWVRQALNAKGEMESLGHGVWGITEKGRKRLAGKVDAPSKQTKQLGGEPTTILPNPNLEEIADDYALAFKQKVLQKLLDLTPRQFERFSAWLLPAYGFTEVQVTGKSGDGGIDGHGKIKVGLALLTVAFQCKRWQPQVGKPEIDKFRGAIQGKYEQGVFFTTSDFSTPARNASIQKGAVPIVLLNGDAIVQLMIDKGLGVRRKPVELYEDQIETLFDEGRDT